MIQDQPGSISHSSFGLVPPDWYYRASKRNLLWMLPLSAKRVLEVGCAEGNFGAFVKSKLGAEVWGIELNPDAAEQARKSLDKVYTGDAATIMTELKTSPFDCIVMFDVLEHMMNPDVVLRKAKNLLSDNGTVILCVPNVLYASNLYRLIIKKDWKYLSHGVLDVTHLRYFTKKSLIRMIIDNDYEIADLRGFEPLTGVSLLPFYVISLLSLGYYHEIKYTQFAAIIKPKNRY